MTANTSTKEDLVNNLQADIETLGLSTRTSNALTEAKLTKLWKLAVLPDRALHTLPGMGKKTIEEIRAKIDSLGVDLNTIIKLQYAFWAWVRETKDIQNPSSMQQVKTVAECHEWASLKQTVEYS